MVFDLERGVRVALESNQLRVLVANEDRDRLEAIAEVVCELGHLVVAEVIATEDVAAATVREHPDVALVGVGRSSQHALDLIGQIVGEAECPVIALLASNDRAFVAEAAKRGIFAYIVDADPESLHNALDIVLLRFAEYHSLEGAFGRRAIIERAKGVLMERHGIDERAAFEALRGYARSHNAKIVDVAQELIGGRVTLSPGQTESR